MDPLTVVIGGALVTAGWLTGRLTKRAPKAREVAFVCSCGHGYGTHQPDGVCLASIERDVLGRSRAFLRNELAPCPCRSYDGPEPLPRVWSPGTS